MKSMATKKEYIDKVRSRYIKVKSRKEKSQIINEVCENLSKDRKYVIKVLNGKYYKIKRKLPKRRPEKYTFDLKKPLIYLWEVSNRCCSKNLQPQIPELLKKLMQFGELRLYPKQEELLCSMSSYTIDKLLKSEKIKYKGKGISGTKKSPLLKSLIPIRTSFNNLTEPGDIELDCVLHCGDSLSGTFAETLNSFDVCSHWSEQYAFLKKNNQKIIGAFHIQKQRFPFTVKSVDFDNGFEFINWAFHGYCKKESIKFTRSRPYHKNDQANIESRNYHTIRKNIGYDRIDKQEIMDLINDIYANEFRLLNNYFYATRKLSKKTKISDGKYAKKYEGAKTPYARLMDTNKLDISVKIKLKEEYDKLNPAELRRNLIIKLRKLKDMISVSKTNLATTW